MRSFPEGDLHKLGASMTDIVERLRAAGMNRVVVGHSKRSLCAEAADALEQRDKDIERLRDERDALRADALRYRWLREHRPILLATGFFGNGCRQGVSEVESVIDAAMAAQTTDK